jgi:hypothetical protein
MIQYQNYYTLKWDMIKATREINYYKNTKENYSWPRNLRNASNIRCDIGTGVSRVLQ